MKRAREQLPTVALVNTPFALVTTCAAANVSFEAFADLAEAAYGYAALVLPAADAY